MSPDSNVSADHRPPATKNATPKATPMTAATTMSRVRQRRSGAGAEAGIWLMVVTVDSLDARTPPPDTRGRREGVDRADESDDRACFLRRYEPDQVPRVCGLATL